MRRLRTASSGSQAASARPNILLITTDQQHHRLAGYAGDRYVARRRWTGWRARAPVSN